MVFGADSISPPSQAAATSHPGWIAELLDGPEEVPEGGHLLLLLGVIALVTLVTEDLTCVMSGLMIANGTLTWTQGIGACLFGILFGDFSLYLAGRKLGRPALEKIPLRWMINPAKLLDTEEWFRRRGGLAILISRFVPGTRLPAYVAAGLMGVSYLKFTVFFVSAALIWTPSLIFLSYKLAGKALTGVEKYHHAAPLIFLALLAAYLFILKIMVPSMNWRGRRQLLARWRRLTHPEYWPTPVLYFPVVCYLLSRWTRRGRHPMDFTACNPCIPGAGVVEESKTGILDQFTHRETVADYSLIPHLDSISEKMAKLTSFMEKKGLSFPIVLKPDIGQRGQQVEVVDSLEEAESVLEQIKTDFIAQHFIPGVEFGVFYIRRPDEERGRIFAITRKTFGCIIGDGKQNIEQLILNDDRALCQAEVHFQKLQGRLFDVPAEGDHIQLTQIGNHCRGTKFEDGMEACTPALIKRIDEISQGIPDFYFGRYDIMAADTERFMRGEDLKVIELNGVSSEATSLYDPNNSYLQMVGTLIRQWKEASFIGWKLQEQGHPRMTFRELLRQYDQYLQRENRRLLLLRRLKKDGRSVSNA